METSSKGVGDVEGKAFAGEGAPGWEECPGEIFLVSSEECPGKSSVSMSLLSVLGLKCPGKPTVEIYAFV